jgi:1-aminocyclopropane-1-carboxylate deaminase
VPADAAFPAIPAPELLADPLYAARGVTLGVLRLDRLHPLWGGNKVFKLLPNLRRAQALGLRRVISFGGAHSNHLHALAAWGHAHGWETVGIVRGEAPAQPGPTLRELRAWGMRLRHVSRTDYRRRADAAWVRAITQDLQPALLIPEGGDNAEGFAGCRALGEAVDALDGRWDVLALACGTGTTLAGLVAGSRAFVLGVAALRDAPGIAARAAAHLDGAGVDASGRFRVLDRFAGRGFARVDAALAAFIGRARSAGLPLDPVYTGKLFYCLRTLIDEGFFARGTRVLAVHTGGLQGARAGLLPAGGGVSL